MTKDALERAAMQATEAASAEQFQGQLQKDVRSWSANEGRGAHDTAYTAIQRPAKAPATRSKKVRKPAAGEATEVKPASGKGRPFSMSYKA